MALPDGLFDAIAIAGKKSLPTIKVAPAREVALAREVAPARHSEGSPLALPSRARFAMLEPEEIST